jgi:hypothetical protein
MDSAVLEAAARASHWLRQPDGFEVLIASHVRRDRVFIADEGDGMAVTSFGRRAVAPEVRRRERAEFLFERTRDHRRQRAHRGRVMSCLAHEPRVLGIGDGVNAEVEVIDVRPMRRTFVVLTVFGPHDELARGDPSHRQQCFVSHFLRVECTQRP